MPLPPDFVVRSGRYRNDTTGVVVYACNCAGSKLTMKALKAQRDNWTQWPPPPGSKPKATEEKT